MSAPHNSTYTSTVEESLHNSTFEVRETSPLRPSVWALPTAPSRSCARTERRERTGGGARWAEVAGVAEVVEARRSPGWRRMVDLRHVCLRAIRLLRRRHHAWRRRPTGRWSAEAGPEHGNDTERRGGGAVPSQAAVRKAGEAPPARARPQRRGEGRAAGPEHGEDAEGRGGAAGPEHGDDAKDRGGAAGPSEAASRRAGAAPPARARPRRGGHGRAAGPEGGGGAGGARGLRERAWGGARTRPPRADHVGPRAELAAAMGGVGKGGVVEFII